MELTSTQLDGLRGRILLTPKPLIAARIREARLDADLTLDGLGELLNGVTRQHLIKLEKAQHRPRAEMLNRIADATGRDVEWFLAPEVSETLKPFQGGNGTGGSQ